MVKELKNSKGDLGEGGEMQSFPFRRRATGTEKSKKRTGETNFEVTSESKEMSENPLKFMKTGKFQ